MSEHKELQAHREMLVRKEMKAHKVIRDSKDQTERREFKVLKDSWGNKVRQAHPDLISTGKGSG